MLLSRDSGPEQESVIVHDHQAELDLGIYSLISTELLLSWERNRDTLLSPYHWQFP